MPTILLVEDDETLANAILYALEVEGFGVLHAGGVRHAVSLVAEHSPDLIILDVMLPDVDGFRLCRQIRERCKTPILFLTARDQETDAIRGLDLGGDDYVTKPFRVREFMLRIRALLRRSSSFEKDDRKVLRSGDIELHPLEASVTRAGRPLQLTPLDYRLPSLFLRYPDRTLSRDAVLENLSDSGPLFLEENTLSVYVRRLREKVEEDPSRPKRIITVRYLGYRWNSSADG